MTLENKRVRIDVRWTTLNKPYVWDLYHYLVNWSDSYVKQGGFTEITVMRDFCSYHILFYREWDYSQSLIILCNNYHQREFRKLQILLRKHFKRYKPKFEKARDFDKEDSSL